MKLTNQDLDILRELLEDKLKEIDYGPEGIEIHFKPEILQKIKNKLDKMLFE
jgi:hypothetical protein